MNTSVISEVTGLYSDKVVSVSSDKRDVYEVVIPANVWAMTPLPFDVAQDITTVDSIWGINSNIALRAVPLSGSDDTDIWYCTDISSGHPLLSTLNRTSGYWVNNGTSPLTLTFIRGYGEIYGIPNGIDELVSNTPSGIWSIGAIAETITMSSIPTISRLFIIYYWNYDTNRFECYSNNPATYKAVAASSTVDVLTVLPAYSGFWLHVE